MKDECCLCGMVGHKASKCPWMNSGTDARFVRFSNGLLRVGALGLTSGSSQQPSGAMYQNSGLTAPSNGEQATEANGVIGDE